MKIALCLSGQMRAMKHCLHTINVAFPDHEVDVFATVWDYEEESNIQFLKDNTNVVYLDRISNKDLAVNESFEKEVIKRGFYNQFHITNWAPVPVWNLLRIEKMARNSFLPVSNNDYDYVVRSRYDTHYLRDLTDWLSRSYILLSEDIGGSAPWDTWKNTRMVFDGFAAGSWRMMCEYYDFSKWLPRYFEHHRDTLKAERTLGWYLEEIASVRMYSLRDILGLQIDENKWYNRSNPDNSNILKIKQKGTFDFYKEDLKKNHPDLFEEVAFCFE